MGNHDDTKRRTGKDKLKDTFNKYGKNTNRGLRIILEIHSKKGPKPSGNRCGPAEHPRNTGVYGGRGQRGTAGVGRDGKGRGGKL
mgnify:CR=1 FL=1|jgi:hypothetical protein